MQISITNRLEKLIFYTLELKLSFFPPELFLDLFKKEILIYSSFLGTHFINLSRGKLFEINCKRETK